MGKRFLIAISALLVCAGILLLRAVSSPPEQAIVESREQPSAQVASSATSPRERDAERPPTERAPANRPENAIQRRATDQSADQEVAEAEPLDTPRPPNDDPKLKDLPGQATRFELEEAGDVILVFINDDDQVDKSRAPSREKVVQALKVVDGVLSDHPEYERALAVATMAACYLGDSTRARQYLSRMKSDTEGGRRKCKALGVEL